MNIHAEKEIVNVKDSQLLSRLLAYTKPYWKMVALCIGLAFLIVLADLARPYLIKLAIDEHINGINKPMITAPANQAEAIGKFGETLEVDGQLYVRTGRKQDLSQLPPAFAKKQILQVEGQQYMIEGWVSGKQEKVELQQENGKTEIIVGTQKYAAIPLDQATVKQFRDGDFRGFISIGLLFLIAVLGAAVLNYLQSIFLQYTGQKIIFNIRQELFQKLSQMSMSYFDRNPVGRLVVRVTQDTESLNQLYSQVVVNLVKDCITIIGIVFIMLQMSVRLSLLAFAVLPLLWFMTFWYRKLVRQAQRKTRMILARLNSFLAENLSGIRITQLFIREERQREQFEHHNQEYYRAGMVGSTINSIFQPAIGFVGNFSIALLIWYGGSNVIDGAVTFGVVYAFTQYIRQFFQPLQSLAEKYNQIQTAMVGAERIFDMLDEKPTIVDPVKPILLPKQVKGEIIFEHVWFAYNEEDWVLRDVSFKIEPSQTIAFVGATGAGKSSIIQLINRFYDIQKGSIKLDGVDIRNIALDDLRHYISIVQQDVFLFTGDIASNIRLNNHEITDEQVKDAASRVHMDEFIKKQPLGYQTPLGERGVTLSLGQRQLLSFARAIAFRPQILILDEATSNIDTETEMIVQDALHSISKGRTTMIVAHRLSTIQHADQIIVMHKGKVREIGNHFQLLTQRGYYFRLYELQFKDQRNMPTAT